MADPIILISPTVTGDTNGYVTGDNVGGLLTLSDAVPPSRPYGMIRGVTIVNDTISASTPFDVFFFNANPSGTTISNNGAQSIASADQAKVIGVAHCSDITSDGACTVHQAQNLSMPFTVPSGTSIYATIVVRGSMTLGAATDVVLTVRIQQAG